MKILKLIIISFISILLVFSCNTEDKDRKNERKAELEKQEVIYQKMVEQYSAVPLTIETISHKFTYELEELYLNKNIACVANVFDIKKIHDNQYQVFAKNESLTYIINIDKDVLNKILSIRSNKIKDDERYSVYFTELIFILQPNKVLKNFGIYKSVSDFTITEGELDDYYVDLELDENGFLIKATGVDLMLVDRFYYKFDK